MPLLNDIKGVFRRRKPVAIDLTTTQASRLSRGPDTSIDIKPLASTSSNGRIDTSRLKAAAPEIEEVISMVRKISTHLETQSRRTDKLVECMDRMPAALEALPEINRRNARLMELINDYLTHARRRDDALNENLAGMTASSDRQTEVLGLLQQQLDAGARSGEELRSGLADFKDAIGDLAGSSRRTTTILSEMGRLNDEREEALQEMLSRTSRWMMAAIGCCAAAAATSVIVGAVAILQ